MWWVEAQARGTETHGVEMRHPQRTAPEARPIGPTGRAECGDVSKRVGARVTVIGRVLCGAATH